MQWRFKILSNKVKSIIPRVTLFLFFQKTNITKLISVIKMAK